jgi:putative transposase
MPRTARSLLADGHYHLINRGNNRSTVFSTREDYRRFLRLIGEAQHRVPLRLLAVCLMPNHFHVVAAQDDPDHISRWMQWLLTTHASHFNLSRGTCGRVWQGRFKAFPIQHDGHLLSVMRYVERNALRAGLVSRAESWPWGSLAWRLRRAPGPQLTPPPCPLPRDWTSRVNEPQSAEELDSLRRCVNQQRPYGSEPWTDIAAARHGLRLPTRGPGRPPKPSAAGASPK